jgi:hypothetical protein
MCLLSLNTRERSCTFLEEPKTCVFVRLCRGSRVDQRSVCIPEAEIPTELVVVFGSRLHGWRSVCFGRNIGSPRLLPFLQHELNSRFCEILNCEG